MIVQLLKPHYWMLDRAFKGSNRYGVIVLISVALFLVERVMNAISLDTLSMDSNVALLLFGGLFGALLLAVLDVNHTLYQLFESRELDILMVNPVPLHTIYALKLMQSSRTLLLCGPLVIGVLLMVGTERGSSVSSLLLLTLSMIGVLVILAALVFAFVLLMTWILPPQRVRNGLFVAFTMLPLALVLLQSEIAVWFGAQTDLHRTIARGLFAPSAWLLLPLPFAGVALIAAYLVFDATFREGRARYRTLTTPRTTTGLGPSTRPLAKEWLLIRREPRLLLRLLQPLVFTFLVLLPLLQGGLVPAGWRQIAFWFLVVIAGLLMVTAPFAVVDLLAREGRTFALIRTQPTRVADLLRVKVLAVWLPQSLVWTACVLLTGAVYGFAPWQVIALTGLVVVGLLLATLAAVGLAATAVDFTSQAIPPVPGVFIMMVNLGWAVSLLMLFASGVWHLLPGNDASAVLEAVSPELFGGMWLPGSVMFLVIAVIALLSWRQGIHRLNQWQITD